MKQNPVFVEYGSGEKSLYVFSPVMPIWDAGEFFRPLTSFFARNGYQITIFDSLSLLDNNVLTFSEFTQRWANALEQWDVPDMVAGGALGGALAQALVGSSKLSLCEKLLLISSPTKADLTLERQLGAMIDLVNAGDIAEAKSLLEQLVIPEGDIMVPHDPSFSTPDFPLGVQGRRLADGFTLLKGLDLTQTIKAYSGRTLSIYGQKSQLVRRVNVCAQNEKTHLLEIPKGGMRPLMDNLPLVLTSIHEQLTSVREVNA